MENLYLEALPNREGIPPFRESPATPGAERDIVSFRGATLLALVDRRLLLRKLANPSIISPPFTTGAGRALRRTAATSFYLCSHPVDGYRPSLETVSLLSMLIFFPRGDRIEV